MRSRQIRRIFFAEFFRLVCVVWPILSGVLFAMVGPGLLIGHIEGWRIVDALYFTFVTGLTIGYGDLTPRHVVSRLLAVVIGLAGIVLTGLVAAAATAFGMTPAFVGFIVVALVGGAAEMASAFSAAGKNRMDLSVSIGLGSASQIALFVAPMLVLLSYVIGPAPMDLQFWPGAVVMVLISTVTAFLVTSSGRSAWFVGVLVMMVYLIFAMTLYLLPPRIQ